MTSRTSTPAGASRVALVSGGSRGLGRALVAALAAAGWRVITDGRDAVSLDAARSAIRESGAVITVPGDVSDPEHRRRLAQAVHAAGGLDLLVNNASLLGPSPQPLLSDYPIPVLEHVYAVNVIAPLALFQSVRSHLEQRQGRVVNVTSDASVEPYEGWGGYGSSKAALDQLTAILGVEHPSLRVYAFDPGDMNTDMHQAAFPGEDISDRPLPETVVPALLQLVDGSLPSGRYRAADIRERVAP